MRLTSSSSRMSAVTSSPTTRPSLSTTTRSVISRTAVRSCEMNSTAAPSATTVLIRSKSRSTSSSGRNTVGSSRTSTECL